MLKIQSFPELTFYFIYFLNLFYIINARWKEKHQTELFSKKLFNFILMYVYLQVVNLQNRKQQNIYTMDAYRPTCDNYFKSKIVKKKKKKIHLVYIIALKLNWCDFSWFIY